MDSTRQFDFSNEGDCVMANDAVKPQTSTAMGSEPTFTFMDLLALSACSDILCHDIEMTEQQMSQLRT